ncbi:MULTISPECIES: ABC transporter permease [unclassified Streptomyces]|uniref:ABC transporter permease n=1 Tax=unclassified Streptomyces TaxID=2593676 RepID=UPI001E2BB6DB|nr:ABC transporter permease [Streptomyces sp. CB02980]MCB8907829.1 ABC transporter permease [Streptomyces sp. CB02980]
MSTLALKGPYWVTVRQYRRTLWLVGAAVAVSLAVIGGLRIWDAQTPDRHYEDGQRYAADDNRGYETLRIALEYGGMWLLLLPLLVGAFVAGPLVAREFESGTYKLSLTQSVSPAAWLRSKLLTTSAVALGATFALMGVYRIGWGRVAGSYGLTWSERGPYEATGIVLLAYVLAAVAVGALVGQLIRRTLVAMAVTGLVMGVVLLVLGAIRWSLLSVQTATGPAGPTLWTPGNGLMMDSGLLTSSGVHFDQSVCWDEVHRTPGLDSMHDGGMKLFDRCLAQRGVTGQYVDYHPQSHFWPTQLIETGIVLALAALAAYAAFRVLRARHP